MNGALATATLGLLLTYAIHSTVLLGLTWLLTRRLVSAPASRDLLWKAALLGGLITTVVQTGWGHRPSGSFSLVAAAAIVPPDQGTGDMEPPAPARDRDPSKATDLGAGGVAARVAGAVEPPAAPGGRGWRSPSPTALAVGGWSVLALLLTLSYLARRLILRGRLTERRSLAGDPLADTLDGLRREAGVRRRIVLTASQSISSPVALGFGEICVPEAALTDLEPDQQRSMLAHELAHLLRRDPSWLHRTSLLERIFFFQPLNRLARRELQESAEYLCDDWAARRAGSGVPLARCLAKVAEWIEASPLGVPVAGMAEQRSLLLSRITRLLHERRGGRARSPIAVAGLAAAGLVATVFVAPGVSGMAAPVEESRLIDDAAQGFPDGSSVGQKDQGASAVTSPSASGSVSSSMTSSTSTGESGEGSGRSASPEGQPQDTTVVAALMLALRDEDAEVRRAAANSLGNLATPRAVPALVAALRDEDPEVRESAADALSNIGDPRAVNPLIALLGDPVADIRRTAIDALGQFEEQVPVAPILRLLSDSDPEIRHSAAHLIGQLGDRSAVPALSRALRDEDPEVREAALESLGEIGDPSAASAIAGALGDANVEVRRQAFSTLREMNAPIDEDLILATLSDADAELRHLAAHLAGERPFARAIPVLRRLLDDPGEDVREAAVEALSEIADPAARQALLSALSSKDPNVRRKAAEALGEKP